MPELTGNVFNIQKFSLHDGPGIRTVVFLKGCPLRCKWCANPESQTADIQILWDATKCLHCGNCVRSCPHKAVCAEGEQVTIFGTRCVGCRACVNTCPAQALKAEGEIITVSQVVKICLQDIDFYEESGGGVTLSGGEALSQPEFSAALAKELKARGIHTAMETTGYAEPSIFDQVTEEIDLLLFDMKHWDAQKHLDGTGVDSRLILENMCRAIQNGREVLPRLPVIPGFNNTTEDAAGFVKRLQEAGVGKIQLLPFHQFGEAKYAQLGRKYDYQNIPALHEEDLQDFRKVFLDAGIDAFF